MKAKKEYQKPSALSVEMSFEEHIAASGIISTTCHYTHNSWVFQCATQHVEGPHGIA